MYTLIKPLLARCWQGYTVVAARIKVEKDNKKALAEK
jgi:hypothetical protein